MCIRDRVVSALRKYIIARGVSIVNEAVTDIDISEGRVMGVFTENTYAGCKNIIIATGGLSYPKTGSTGDGYRFAKKAGHTVTYLKPSLVPLVEKGHILSLIHILTLLRRLLTKFQILRKKTRRRQPNKDKLPPN